jgi:hypothetical protein
VPFSPFGNVKPLRYDNDGKPASFDFLRIDC